MAPATSGSAAALSGPDPGLASEEKSVVSFSSVSQLDTRSGEHSSRALSDPVVKEEERSGHMREAFDLLGAESYLLSEAGVIERQRQINESIKVRRVFCTREEIE